MHDAKSDFGDRGERDKRTAAAVTIKSRRDNGRGADENAGDDDDERHASPQHPPEAGDDGGSLEIVIDAESVENVSGVRTNPRRNGRVAGQKTRPRSRRRKRKIVP